MSAVGKCEVTSRWKMRYYCAEFKEGLSLLLGEIGPSTILNSDDLFFLRGSRRKYKRFMKRDSSIFRISQSRAEELIIKDVNFNVVNTLGDTLLHGAINRQDCDFATMLLYYNIDTSIVNNSGYTAFMMALQCKNHKMQSLLLEYESDFANVTEEGLSVLELAVRYKSQLVREILDKDVGCYPFDKFIAFSKNYWITFDTFRMLWDRIEYENFEWGRYDSALGYAVCSGPNGVFEYILKSGKLQQVLDETYAVRDQNPSELHEKDYEHPYFFIEYAIRKYNSEKSFEMIYILLMHGYQPNYFEVEMILETFGRCQLFDLCLELDLKPSRLRYTSLLACIILDVSKTTKQITERFVNSIDAKREYPLLESNIKCMSPYSCDRYLCKSFKNILHTGIKLLERYYTDQDDLERNLKLQGLALDCSTMEKLNEKLPSLQELSRDVARKYICNKYCIENYNDFRRILKAMNIGRYAKILNFEMPIYH